MFLQVGVSCRVGFIEIIGQFHQAVEDADIVIPFLLCFCQLFL